MKAVWKQLLSLVLAISMFIQVISNNQPTEANQGWTKHLPEKVPENDSRKVPDTWVEDIVTLGKMAVNGMMTLNVIKADLESLQLYQLKEHRSWVMMNVPKENKNIRGHHSHVTEFLRSYQPLFGRNGKLKVLNTPTTPLFNALEATYPLKHELALLNVGWKGWKADQKAVRKIVELSQEAMKAWQQALTWAKVMIPKKDKPGTLLPYMSKKAFSGRKTKKADDMWTVVEGPVGSTEWIL